MDARRKPLQIFTRENPARLGRIGLYPVQRDFLDFLSSLHHTQLRRLPVICLLRACPVPIHNPMITERRRKNCRFLGDFFLSFRGLKRLLRYF